jgi:hypothetical protein
MRSGGGFAFKEARPEQFRQRRGQAEAKYNPRDEEEKEHRDASLYQPIFDGDHT